MRYCTKCVLPDTRPGIEIGIDGVCSGCKGHQQKLQSIDWAARKRDLETLFDEARKKSNGYDCIVPVSGGKDSTWQVVKCREYGLRTLAITWRTPARTNLGQKNLDNLIRLGVDHIDYSIDPEVERKFTYQSFVKTGSSAVPMHMAIFTIPLKFAVSLNVPLVIWGESPHMEYGGTDENRNYHKLDHGWLKRHGILQGTSAEDWVGDDLTRKDLEPYFLPEEEQFRKMDINSIFLGYFLPWDPEESLRVALANGFQVRTEGPKFGYYNYADIDCDFISVHHHFKWLKFGFTRLFDNLAIEIRNGRMTRDQAIGIIRSRGDQTPHEDIAKLCGFLRMSREKYLAVEERFRNRDIWSFRNGKWVIPHFLVDDWTW